MSFSIIDQRIWIRNYQIIENSPLDSQKEEEANPISLSEIGPRFVLEIVRIFDQSFGGSTLYENSSYVTPNTIRSLAKQKAGEKFKKRQLDKMQQENKKRKTEVAKDPLDYVFK
jgi:ribosome biogenesis protein BRX1